MASWRLARSLEKLRSEIQSLHPGTTVWTIGDAAHRDRPSDHNPNGQGVVCAIDVLGDKGLDLGRFAERLAADPHPALKYVIYRRRIASRSSGFVWRPYTGPNPHDDHVHVSVGTGPDGKSVGPYDDTSPWLDASSTGGMDMFCKHGDQSPAVEALQRLLADLGFNPGQFDGYYLDKTSAALSAARKAAGNKVTNGDEYTPAAWHTLQVLLAKKYAGKDGARGPKGDKGDRGPAGELTLPARLTITAVERAS